MTGASHQRSEADPRRGDAAFDHLYRTHYPQVLAYCLRRTSRASAEDAAAEVFTVAWRRLADIPPGQRTLPWLYGVAYRVISHQWRSARRFRNLATRLAGLGQQEPAGPETQVVRRAEDQLVIDAASRLSASDQEILRLAGWERLPHEQIASVLGISVAAVAQRFSRAKKRLAKEYDRHVRPPDAKEGGRR